MCIRLINLFKLVIYVYNEMCNTIEICNLQTISIFENAAANDLILFLNRLLYLCNYITREKCSSSIEYFYCLYNATCEDSKIVKKKKIRRSANCRYSKTVPWNVINHSTRRQFDALRWKLSRKNTTSLKLHVKLQQLNLFLPRYNLGHLENS